MANKKKTGGSKKRNHEPAAVKYNRKRYSGPRKKLIEGGAKSSDGKMRLNKYLAHAGVCSRREADELIKLGSVSVNGEVVTEMGYRVGPSDVVKYEGQKLSHENLVYLVINKPKNFLATTDDHQSRRTLYDLIKNACREVVLPVGNMDRNTTGVLLITNDTDLITKLTNPKHEVKRVYQIGLSKSLAQEDFEKIQNGVMVGGTLIKVDDIAYLSAANKKEIGLEIHTSKNKIVRKLFEELGYSISKLDRVYYAGLTKKNLSRGQYRFLTPEEVGQLKRLG